MASSIESTSTTTTLKNNGNTYVSVDTNDDVTITNDLAVSGTLNTTGAVVHNEVGAAVDFRVEGDTDPHLIFADASVDRVAIGGSDTSLFNGAGTNAKLAVIGSSNDGNVLQNGSAAIVIVNTDVSDENTAGLHFARADTDDTPNYAGASIVAQFKETQATGQYPSATMNFLTSTTQNAAPTVKVTIAENGNLGIGTIAPSDKLQVAGGITATSFNGGQLAGMRNRIINGDMRIDQRNAAAAVTITTGNEWSVDRFNGVTSVSSKYSLQQTTTAPVGFVNSIKALSLSAYTVGTSEQNFIRHHVEGLNMGDLNWGTSGAKTVTLSFQVRSSLTGTFGGSIFNYNGSRSYPFSYSIGSADTWTTISLTITGDTTGTWLATNGVGMTIGFTLGTGSGLSGTAGAWMAGYNSSASSTVSILGTSGATLYITGVQLEVGSVATPFEHRSYGTELASCQRYFQTWGGNSNNERIGNGFNYLTTQSRVDMVLPVTMRTAPTLNIPNVSHWAVEYGAGAIACTSIGLDQASTKIAAVNFNVSSGLTVGQGNHLNAHGTTAARLNLSAEL